MKVELGVAAGCNQAATAGIITELEKRIRSAFMGRPPRLTSASTLRTASGSPGQAPTIGARR
ncbi:hypothetical protein XC71_30115 [Klebsiella pneumoniae]|nr:hypothetical protein [Klebsiella pneumoniae]